MPDATLHPPAAECPDCGLVMSVRHARAGKACCPRCSAVVAEPAGEGLQSSLALALTALVLLVLANAYPILTFSLGGRSQSNLLVSGVFYLWRDGEHIVAGTVLFMSLLAPLGWVLSVLVATAATLANFPAPVIRPALKLASHLAPWNVVSIYFVGIIVSVARLQLLGEVEFQAGSFFVVAFSLVGLLLGRTFKPSLVWNELGRRP